MKDPRDEIQYALQHQDFLERIDAMRGYDAAEKRLLDRLEAAEKERDELLAKIAEMEKQEPVAWTTRLALESVGRGTLGFHACGGNLWGYKGVALYTTPGALPAPSVPDGWKLVRVEPTSGMSLHCL